MTMGFVQPVTSALHDRFPRALWEVSACAFTVNVKSDVLIKTLEMWSLIAPPVCLS